MSVLNKAAIYYRDTGSYGSFEPDDPHSTVAYPAGSAMTYIIDKKLDFCGLYVDEADSTSSMEALSRECANGIIEAVIVNLCDRHTGDFPKEKKLDHAPKISVQDLTKKVAQQYNEHLSDMGYFREKQIWVTDLCIE